MSPNFRTVLTRKKAVSKSLKTPAAKKAISRQRQKAEAAAGADFRMEPIEVYAYDPTERIEVIRRGIPAGEVSELASRMNLSKEWVMEHLRISRATLNRKVRDKKPLSQDESERVLGMATLIGQVETMIAQSGDPHGFDVAQWMASWINTPIPALGGHKPAEFLDTVEGQKLISSLLATAQSGAYA